MSAAITHLAYSAGFTPAAGSLWSITDLVDLSESEGGNVTELTTDNSQVVNGLFVSSIKGDITVTTKDHSHRNNAGALVGTVGSLVVKYGKRTAGKGFTSGAYITVTYANAMLETITPSAGVVGDGTLNLKFQAYGTDGTTIKTVSIGA